MEGFLRVSGYWVARSRDRAGFADTVVRVQIPCPAPKALQPKAEGFFYYLVVKYAPVRHLGAPPLRLPIVHLHRMLVDLFMF